MKTLRAAGLGLVLAAAGLLAPAGAASAATTGITAYVNCDADTGEVTTWTSGILLIPGPSKPVKVEFKRTGGARVTATASNVLAPMAQPFTVTVPSTTAGGIEAVGYTGTFNTAALYYNEKITVTYKNATTGDFYATREASCNVDQRTTVTLTCDPQTRTYSAAVAGLNGQAGSSDGAGRPSTVRYRTVTYSQASRTDPMFVGQQVGGWDVSHRVIRAADGSWSDVGYTTTGNTARPPSWYSAEEVTVGVFDQYGTQVGAGRAKCVMFRDGQPEGY